MVDAVHPADLTGSANVSLKRGQIGVASDAESPADRDSEHRRLLLMAHELRDLRRQRDRHIEGGRLAIAGECSVEIEQLTRAYVARRDHSSLPGSHRRQ